jgi:hypothetical protein
VQLGMAHAEALMDAGGASGSLSAAIVATFERINSELQYAGDVAVDVMEDISHPKRVAVAAEELSGVAALLFAEQALAAPCETSATSLQAVMLQAAAGLTKTERATLLAALTTACTEATAAAAAVQTRVVNPLTKEGVPGSLSNLFAMDDAAQSNKRGAVRAAAKGLTEAVTMAISAVQAAITALLSSVAAALQPPPPGAASVDKICQATPPLVTTAAQVGTAPMLRCFRAATQHPTACLTPLFGSCFLRQTEGSGEVVTIDGGVEQLQAAVVAAPPPAPPPAPTPPPAPSSTPPPIPAPPVPVAAALPVSLPPVAAAAAPVLSPPNPIATFTPPYTPSSLHACCLAATCPVHGHGTSGATCAPRTFPASGKEVLLVERAVARMCAFLEGGTVMLAQNRISAPELFVSLDANRDGLLVRGPAQPPGRSLRDLRRRKSVAFAVARCAISTPPCGPLDATAEYTGWVDASQTPAETIAMIHVMTPELSKAQISALTSDMTHRAADPQVPRAPRLASRTLACRPLTPLALPGLSLSINAIDCVTGGGSHAGPAKFL